MIRYQKLRVRPLLSLVLVFLLVACGQGPGVQITLDAASVELVRGGTVEVLVTLTRTGGASAELTLSATGLPANVDASFSPATLVGVTLTSTLTLSATATAPEGEYAVTVTASGIGLSATSALELDVVSLTVTGRVIAAFGIPIPGASVRAQGDSSVTDTDGTFTLSGLAVPYDLSVWSTVNAWVHVYEGLTSADVVLSPFEGVAAITSTMSTTISGSLSGGTVPVGPNQSVLVCAEGVDGTVVGCADVGPGESSYSFAAEWLNSESRKIVLHALQVETDSGSSPVSYPGYTSIPLTITHANPVDLDLDLGTALATETVTVKIDSTAALAAVLAAVQLGPDRVVPVGGVPTPGSSVDVLMPVIPGASYTFVGVQDLQTLGWRAGVTGTTATVTMPGAITLLAPADAAPNVTNSTAFSASTTPGAPLTFTWGLDSNNVHVAVTTMATSHVIPDLVPFGLALPGNAASTWHVIRHRGPSVDDATNLTDEQANLYWLIYERHAREFTSEGSLVTSTPRDFTTAP